ncbi:MAG TPA: hypothetical protein VL995_18060 [Cellvibrio sp.]|nr:hypothetical protein [Cellvibrio sp.]
MRSLFFALMFVAAPVFAWKESANQTIVEIMAWENTETTVVHFKLANGTWCYIPASQKTLNSIILTLYASGKKGNFHCHDTADSNAGGSVPGAHKLHRISAIN